ncbi:hypothetical protein GCM10009839_51990 [Catenulispora yoronensis]|uniref:LUD domain-containing protein n=1 Tax=Catenulispora yoronensis TaxID=450799 RepID=A0ABN2USR4_9ACTN
MFTASSETLRLAGIAEDVDASEDHVSVRTQLSDIPADDVDARIRLGALPDVVVGSVHAVTEEGHLVVASATGSQFAPYAAGAKKAVWVVGAQKIVPDLETALRRIRTYTLGKEHQHLRELAGQGSFIGKILIIEREALPERGTVVLVPVRKETRPAATVGGRARPNQGTVIVPVSGRFLDESPTRIW